MKIAAHAERSGDWWALSVSEVRGLHSQAKRLDRADAMNREAAALYFDLGKEEIDVTVIPHVPGVDTKALRANVDERRRTLQEAEVEAVRASRNAVATLRAQGLSVRDVATLLGPSAQRVSQLQAQRPA